MNRLRTIGPVAAMVLVLAVLLGAVLAQLDVFRRERTWTISTGFEGGTYHELGARLAASLSASQEFDEFRAVPSAGSAENVERLARAETDLAIVQSDAELPVNARAVASLYRELMHVFVRTGLDAEQLEDLAALQAVSLGPVGSGTRQAAKAVLTHFELELASRLELEPDQLVESFRAGELDAAFVLAGPGSRLPDALADSGLVRLVSMGRAGDASGGEAAGFALLHPAFHAAVLPARLYGRAPEDSLATIGVTALLVANAALDEGVVRAATEELFRRRNELGYGLDTPLALAGLEAPIARLPFHPGAEAYYLRERPSFLVEYAEVISLGITLLVGAWSLATLFLRWTATRKKERIDTYYAEITRAAAESSDVRLEHLETLHRRAFEELMAERLAANESFTIFHDYLLSEIDRAERQRAEARRTEAT